jgi:hypothetical protein
MKFRIYALLASLLVGCLHVHAVCPANAVFLALQDQIRGYSLRANGPTTPCQILAGPNTTLSTAQSIAFDKLRNFHVAQFLTDSTLDIFPPHAAGNLAPTRFVMFDENDLVSIAVDSHLNDFVMSIRQAAVPIFVAPKGSQGSLANPVIIADGNLMQYTSLAVDEDDNLLVAGYDANGAARIDTFATSQSLASPHIVRSITGSATGLLAGSGPFGSNNLTIALDPQTNELYVYNSNTDGTKVQVSVFARESSGDVKPARVISGPLTKIGVPGFGTKIGVSTDGRLFVAEPNNRILVFAPGTNGNVPPSQVIQDSTIGSAHIDQGGIGVRSGCQCAVGRASPHSSFLE